MGKYFNYNFTMASVVSSTKNALKTSIVGSDDEPSSLTKQNRTIFEKFATAKQGDEVFMNQENFVDAIAPADEDYHKIRRDQFRILFTVADRSKRGLITMQDWLVFCNLVSRPDAEYEIAFKLFDIHGNGAVSYDDFIRLCTSNRLSESIPFDFNVPWATLYVGGKKQRHEMTYHQFSQMLRGLQGERIRQAFHHFDRNQDGYIDPVDFQHIILETSRHKLSDIILDNLQTLCNVTGNKVSYANVRAFQNLMTEMDMVASIVESACRKSSDGKITRSDFANEAALSSRFGLFTPMEIDILFHFASLDNQSGRLGVNDFTRVLDPSWQDDRVRVRNEIQPSQPKVASGSILEDIIESAYHFGLGAVAGGIGATLVYPIDLVKTRMQNQRSNKLVGELLYRNSLDCAKKVLRNEGFLGFYSGLGPQLIGVAPEKAIKLTVNDLVRGKATDKNGNIPVMWEIIAGGSAGGCQVIFTNPLEIVKIRLQVQGEIAKTMTDIPKRSALWIVKNLGLFGLYKGASACLLRDIPFSAIYFPTYAHLKKDMFKESPTHKLSIGELLIAGAIAGMPAAYLTTPADVIKTRLQVEARKGEATYKNIHHAFTTILKEEGFRAFFKGGPARVLRSSPQFGATLASYELLQGLFPLPGHASHDPVASDTKTRASPMPYLRSRNALKVLLDIDENFGRSVLTTHGNMLK